MQPWFDEDWGQTVIQQKITREYITNENDALLKYPNNFQGGYALVNQEKTNKWGIPRGYAIHPGYSPVHNARLPFRLWLQVMTDLFLSDGCGVKKAAEQCQLGEV
jgi:Cu2+-containing amine oxidase